MNLKQHYSVIVNISANDTKELVVPGQKIQSVAPDPRNAMLSASCTVLHHCKDGSVRFREQKACSDVQRGSFFRCDNGIRR